MSTYSRRPANVGVRDASLLNELFRERAGLDAAAAQSPHGKADGATVTVDETIFYALSGGQESDTGTIAGLPVREAVTSRWSGVRVTSTKRSPTWLR